MKTWFLLAYFTTNVYCDSFESFDFIEEALAKYRNQSVDPCENFYRHACSSKSPKDNTVVAVAFQKIKDYIENNKRGFYRDLSLVNDYKNFYYIVDSMNNEAALTGIFTQAVSQTCAKNEKTGETLVQKFLRSFGFEKHVSEVKGDCRFLTKLTKKYVFRWLDTLQLNALKAVPKFGKKLISLTSLAASIRGHLDFDVREGITRTRDLVFSVKKIGMDLIKLGYTGSYVGHEIGHTFFGDYDHEQILPYFSKNVDDCVQKQFNSTCNMFRETSCETSHVQLEENGADIFGLQMAYKLLEGYYGSKLRDTIERLQITYEQLFFYAYALPDCSASESKIELKDNGEHDEHSATNVRVNVVVQLPAFKEAFKCSADSKMMRSATEQCHIYGSQAPESKKKQ